MSHSRDAGQQCSSSLPHGLSADPGLVKQCPRSRTLSFAVKQSHTRALGSAQTGNAPFLRGLQRCQSPKSLIFSRSSQARGQGTTIELSLRGVGTLAKLQFRWSPNKSPLCPLGIQTSASRQRESALLKKLASPRRVVSTGTLLVSFRESTAGVNKTPIFKRFVPRTKNTNFA